MSQSVVSQVRSEREASWPVQFARAFEDLHFVYAGLGAMSATVTCVAAIAGLLYFAPAQRDDSLSGLLAAMAAPGSNRNPLSLDERMELPRVDDDHVDVLEGLPESATPHPTALAVAGVLTQEGRGRPGVVPAGQGRRRARAAGDARGVDDALPSGAAPRLAGGGQPDLALRADHGPRQVDGKI